MKQPKRLSEEELEVLFMRIENGESVSSEDLKGHIQALEAEHKREVDMYKDVINFYQDITEKINTKMRQLENQS